ncbi:DUF6049 family protein [Streptomyces sp. CAU 1734]|uniref:DUF6049 family protein n=1 Tax=Streptomyces sp. CAU 1734 TaxID=3140360 RepID=UPI00326036A7
MAKAAFFQGTPSSPARRWLRRTASAAVGVPLLAGLLGIPAASAAPGAEKERSGSRTVDVALDTVSPAAPGEGDTLTVSGTVTNRGKRAIGSAEIDLYVSPRLVGRTAIDSAGERTGYNPAADGSPIGDKHTEKLPKLLPGISRDFSFTVPVDDLELGENGVYQLGVGLTGQPSGSQFDQVLGMGRTFLPWQPEELEKKTRITYLWPLISSTHVTSETGSDEEQTPVLEDETLAAELAPEGRLGQLVSLGRDLPVTWVMDPDLLATVDAMTEKYQVKDGDRTVPGRNQDVAKEWLSALETAVRGDTVVALPFADPDLASLAHRGKDVSGSLSRLQQATEAAESTVETVLHEKPYTDFAWPVDGAIDSSIVDVATSAGADKVITRGDSLRDNLGYTASAARPIGGGTTAVVSDSRLSKAFQGNMVDSSSSTRAVQEFIAQTLALTLQDTDQLRSIVVAPQRMPTVSQAQSMARALEALEPQSWTQPMDLVTAAAVKPDPNATTKVPPASRYPERLRKQELPVRAFEDSQKTQNDLDRFTEILTQMDRVETPFGRAIDREMSTSWRGNPSGAQLYRVGVRNNLQTLTEEVQLIQKSQITLSGRSATIPVTVQNRLVQGVDRLVLRLSSDNGARLSVGGDGEGTAEQPISVKGGHSQSVKFNALAHVNGQVQMTAQLYTEDNEPYGEKMQFTVKVSEITPTVMLVLAGGVLLLVLAGIRMYTQRKRAAAREAAARAGGQDGAVADAGNPGAGPEAGGGDGENTSPDGAERPEGDIESPDHGQPSDPTPDTGPESGKPSGPGEKVDR